MPFLRHLIPYTNFNNKSGHTWYNKRTLQTNIPYKHRCKNPKYWEILNINSSSSSCSTARPSRVTTSKTWKPPQCPSVDTWIKKV